MVDRLRRHWLIALVLVAAPVLIWLVLDQAFRAPEVVPVLQQIDNHAGRDLATTAATVRQAHAQTASADSTTAAATDASAAPIDCSNPEKAKTELLDRFDRSFGREFTELFLSGAADWHERHPPDISQSWDKSDPHGVNAPATYNAYTDAMLRTTADNGDMLAAAVYGARIAAQYLRGDGSNDEATLQQQLALAERYLQQGVQGRVSGALGFLWQIAEFRVNRDRKWDDNSRKPVFTNRDAVIELHARTLLNQMYGTFEERIMAHALLLENVGPLLPSLDNAKEHEQALHRARQLGQALQAQPAERSEAERRAENAAVALISKMSAQANLMDTLRCHDGREVSTVVSGDVLDELLERYKK
ncbi:MAG: hypothetical protein ACOY3E_01115 [Pseudomonadota bacterium]